ncbi:hypothetical protein D3C87_1557290 [compost metagenome]
MFYYCFIKGTGFHLSDQLQQVIFQSRHYHFCFRITHTAVIFNYKWIAIYIDQTKEYESVIRNLFCSQALDRGFNHLIHYFLHKLTLCKRHRRDSPHTTGIQAFVSLTDTLIVFCLWQQHIMFTIGKGKNR